MTKPTKEITTEEDNCNHPSDGIIRDSKEVLRCNECGEELNDLLRNKAQLKEEQAISKKETKEIDWDMNKPDFDIDKAAKTIVDKMMDPVKRDLGKIKIQDQQNEAISKTESTELISWCDCVTPKPDSEYHGVCKGCGNNLASN